jgi:nucleoside-diphosphate-sugar epimerase
MDGSKPTPSSLVIGASGAIGRFLIPRLLDAGHEVVAVSRVACGGDPRVRWCIGDLHREMPAISRPAVVFSLGPLDAFARWFAQTPIDGARVIAFGSMSIDSKRASADPGERELAERLQAAETLLTRACDAHACAWTVFRPTLIYGAGNDRSLTPIARFGARWRVFPRIAAARGLRQPVHAQDLAAACMAALPEAATHGRVYALGGAERLSFADMLDRVRASLPLRTLAVPVPLRALRSLSVLARAMGLPAPSDAAIARLTCDLLAEHAAASADFGWSPRAFHPDAAAWQPR